MADTPTAALASAVVRRRRPLVAVFDPPVDTGKVDMDSELARTLKGE